MKMHAMLALAACLALGLGSALLAEDNEAKDPLAVAKCPVSGKAVKADAAVAYKEGKVYFCCNGCPEAFKKDTAKFASKANQQLAATGQYTEAKCPLTGAKLNPETKISIAGADVAFCCNGCKGKATKLEGAEQIDFVFNDKAFAKGFVPAKAE